MLALLISPITWGQHCVATVPAVLLFFHRWLMGEPMSRVVQALALIYAIIVVGVNRTFLGKELSLVLESYHFVTWSLVILLFVVLQMKEQLHQRSDPFLCPPIQVDWQHEGNGSMRLSVKGYRIQTLFCREDSSSISAPAKGLLGGIFLFLRLGCRSGRLFYLCNDFRFLLCERFLQVSDNSEARHCAY